MIEKLRHQAKALFNAGVRAADPALAVDTALKQAPLAASEGRLFVVAVGKAAMGMAGAALSDIGQPARLIIVTNYENASPLNGAEVFAAAHPVPDENGLSAAMAVIELLQDAGDGDQVLALISGGGSALLPAPVAGVSLADKAAANRLLLASGLEITDMNLVRQQLSLLKGGGFLHFAAPAKVTALILSDVIGDDLRAIASGPTVAPIGSAGDAKAVLIRAGIWNDLPAAVTTHLDRAKDALNMDYPAPDNRLIGSNMISCRAMAAAAKDARLYPQPLTGDVEQAARKIVSAARAGITLFGGETTVQIHGTGLGGRNQELALRVALLAEQAGWDRDWVFLSAGTDGRDGPTDAAGGLVDGNTLNRMRANGADPLRSLAHNDSYHGLQAAGDLLITGATGTNVADLQVLIRC